MLQPPIAVPTHDILPSGPLGDGICATTTACRSGSSGCVLRRTQVLVLALATNSKVDRHHATGARPVRACWGDSSDSGCSSRMIAFAILDLSITSRILGVDLVGSRRIWPAHVGCLVGPDGSRRNQKDRLDDQTDDQSASDKESDGKASK
jgi:hypothetical protein